jgi:replicative DNA helicase
MKPYDIEKIVLGHVLKWGEEAIRLLSDLTPDKFVYSCDGDLGGIDHQIIWEAMLDLFLNQHRSPTYAVLTSEEHVDKAYHEYLRQLVYLLDSEYIITALDMAELEKLGRIVDKDGLIYGFAIQAKNTATIIETPEYFASYVGSVDEIERWLSDQLGKFRSLATFDHVGYSHVSTGVDKVLENWERQIKGEQLVLLPVGMPTILHHHLFPVGKLAVVHGLSGSGKSTFVHQINLGTAIGLVAKGISGCVAVNSLEMQQEDLIEKFIGCLAHVDTSKFVDGCVNDNEYRELKNWAEFVAQLPIWIDDTNFQTTSALQYRSSGLHVSDAGPVRQLSSDYTELFHDTDGDSEEQRVSKVVREHFRLSRSIGASVIVISQSTADKQGTAKTYVAGPDGTRYSRGILQAADILMEVWNPVAMRQAMREFVVPNGLNDAQPWVIVQKYRKGGKPGYFPLGWVPHTTTFFDTEFDQTEGQEIIFEHMEAALEALGMGARVMPFADSPLSTVKLSSNGNGHQLVSNDFC